MKPKHTTDAGTKWFDISPSEGEIDSGDEKWFNTTEASMEASFLDDFRRGKSRKKICAKRSNIMRKEES